jgi:hypothetical protein
MGSYVITFSDLMPSPRDRQVSASRTPKASKTADATAGAAIRAGATCDKIDNQMKLRRGIKPNCE